MCANSLVMTCIIGETTAHLNTFAWLSTSFLTLLSRNIGMNMTLLTGISWTRMQGYEHLTLANILSTLDPCL